MAATGVLIGLVLFIIVAVIVGIVVYIVIERRRKNNSTNGSSTTNGNNGRSANPTSDSFSVQALYTDGGTKYFQVFPNNNPNDNSVQPPITSYDFGIEENNNQKSCRGFTFQDGTYNEQGSNIQNALIWNTSATIVSESTGQTSTEPIILGAEATQGGRVFATNPSIAGRDLQYSWVYNTTDKTYCLSNTANTTSPLCMFGPSATNFPNRIAAGRMGVLPSVRPLPVEWQWEKVSTLTSPCTN